MRRFPPVVGPVPGASSDARDFNIFWDKIAYASALNDSDIPGPCIMFDLYFFKASRFQLRKGSPALEELLLKVLEKNFKARPRALQVLSEN